MTKQEAIEVYNGLINEKIKEAFEFFAPELAESKDERIRQLLLRFVKYDMPDNYSDEISVDDCYYWLEKQKENTYGELMAYGEREHQRGFDEGVASVKPAEWSDIDEFKLQTIEAVITRQKGSAAFGGFLPEELIDFLKSLRPQPHWKPSEEQMDALNSIILNGSFTYVGQAQDLISLKDDLKSL